MTRHRMITAYIFRMACVLFMLMAALLCIGGCSSSRTAREEGSIPVYYLNKERTSITAAAYIPDAAMLDAEHAQELVQDLLVQMTTPMDAAEQIAAISDSSVSSWELEDNTLTLNMSADYRRLDRTREILVRAALVNTMCEVRGVENVALTIEGEPLTDADGDLIGSQSGEDFIFSSDSELRTYERVQLHLYYANESGTGLVSTYRTVVYNSNIALERLVVEEVIKGPNTDVVYPTLNEETRILSVTTRDGTCYVNLDRNLLSDPYDVTSRVAIYSLVNSLTELSSVSSVQISVDGSTQENFMDTSLSNVFTQDLSLVENS